MGVRGPHFSSESETELSPGELRELLERLEEIEPRRELFSESVTIAAVAEVTGEAPERLAKMLDRIRREDYEARLSTMLRELEEPLYRVERAGVQPKTTITEAYLARSRTFDTLLDRLPTVDRQALLPRKEKPGPVERASVWASIVMLGSIAILTIGLVFRAVTQTP
jgi:hypothetical protein